MAGSIINRFISFIRRKTSQQYKFDQQYEQHKWDGLRAIEDLARYSIIVGFVRHFFPDARVLDLGCGEGVLLEKFAPSDYSSYVGVDFSEAAIVRARAEKESGKVKFVVGDLDKLQIQGTFDAIIYNESLYYLKHPKRAVQSLSGNLAPDGIFIISMVDKHGREREGLWQEMDGIMTLLEKTRVYNKAGDSWTVRVYGVR